MNTSAPHSALKRLRHAMIDAGGVTLRELGPLAGLSESLIGKIATGHKKPSRRAARRIELVLGCRIFSTAPEYRELQKRLSSSTIEIDDSPKDFLSPPSADSPSVSQFLPAAELTHGPDSSDASTIAT